ncbi:Uncharacterized protein APZ42_010413 [Daphnia magna]|uniref:Uncharacterized protein n=1 Tax=Daphnia magna TaxID=35525 RepID=A0A162BP32_9CRUS|nr:Uncharacterized protein APZ42_010413 [Daphnia magna]
MIFSVKNNCSGIKIFPAVWVRRIFMETGVLHGQTNILSSVYCIAILWLY